MSRKKKIVAVTIKLTAQTTLQLDTIRKRVLEALCAPHVCEEFRKANFNYETIQFVSADVVPDEVD